MITKAILLSFVLCLGYQSTLAKGGRDAKLLSLFNVVTFPNDPCKAGSKNGTCYTKEECSTKGGTNDGSCASGYGVCCTFSVRCGRTISENNTYFESGGSESGSCSVKICPCNSNICQLRLDFETFVITGPSTGSSTDSTIGKGVNGICCGTAGVDLNYASKCMTDIFQANGVNGNSPPAICGTNTGQHMYVDANKACNDLSFILGQAGYEATLAARSWSIKVTQFDCGYENLAPSGCTQYFYGSNTGTVLSYNWDGNYHLADQNQVACIRREKGNCKMCYSTTAVSDIQISAKGDASKSKFFTKSCCGYKGDGMGTLRDCIQIPSLSTVNGKLLQAQHFCGQGGLGTKDASQLNTAMKLKTLCTKKQPFSITFNSDTFEFKDEAKVMNNGFKIAYIGSSTNC